jgi:hypothetical protein
MPARVRDLRVACGMDWGNASPGCVLWGVALPNGHVHVFDEVKFQRLPVRQVAELVQARHAEWGLTRVPVYADPALRGDTGQMGESMGATFARFGVPLLYPSNDRLNGWQRVHEALAPCRQAECVTPERPLGTPWLTVDPRCRYLARTMPLMVQSKANPEDVDTETDDHACDALRYLLMGGLRPQTGRREPELPVGSHGWWRRYHARAASRQGVLSA